MGRRLLQLVLLPFLAGFVLGELTAESDNRAIAAAESAPPASIGVVHTLR